METVEMDLMQAQIGSLATDVSRLEAKVAAGSENVVEIVTISGIEFSAPTLATGTASKSAIEINNMMTEGKVVFVKADIPTQGVYIAPIQGSSSELATIYIISGMTVVGYDISNIKVMHITISPTNLAQISIDTGTF